MTIRQVLGGDLLTLIRLISREHLRVMAVGETVVLPLSYWAVYRVDISALWYLLTLTLVSTLLLLIVSLQTRLSTSDNPVEVLKDQFLFQYRDS